MSPTPAERLAGGSHEKERDKGKGLAAKSMENPSPEGYDKVTTRFVGIILHKQVPERVGLRQSCDNICTAVNEKS